MNGWIQCEAPVTNALRIPTGEIISLNDLLNIDLSSICQRPSMVIKP